MDSSRDDSSSDDTNNTHSKRHYQRHTSHQIQRLEASFKECCHPNDLQRRQLGEELNLRPTQIKYWFQSKRTKTKSYNVKGDNAALRADNMELEHDNEAIKEALKNVLCPPCGGRGFGSVEKSHNLQNLVKENEFLKRKLRILSRSLAQNRSRSTPRLDGPSTYGSTSSNSRALDGTSSNHLLQPSSSSREPCARENININITPSPQPRKPILLQHFPPLSEMEKMVMFEMGEKSVAELRTLIEMEELMWKKSSIDDDRLVIDPSNYEKCFPTIQVSGGRHESSKEIVVVQMDAKILVDMFLDTEKWARLFPTIVSEAKTIYVLDAMDNGSETFSRVIYEQMHILSPLVPPREFIILRRCHQIEENVWMIADVSCKLPNVEFESSAPICTKLPSGVLIQALPHGCSKVTWIEHVEVTDKMQLHRLYKDLLYGGFGYGARRWTVTLERMCVRLYLSSLSDFSNNDYAGVVQTIEGRRSVMNLGERMLKNFAWVMKMSDKLDFSQLSETNSSGIRVSVRKNKEPGTPPGLIICAASSLSLPLPPLQVYYFLRNPDVRHLWDVLCHGIQVIEAARLVTGTNDKNNVNFLQRSSGEDNNSSLVILQDGYIDALGGMVVYAPMDLNTAMSAISGQVDPSTIQILPTGFTISRDGRPNSADELHGGISTLLTVAFQIPVFGQSDDTDLNLQESTAAVNSLISSTVQRIKAMLNCDDHGQ